MQATATSATGTSVARSNALTTQGAASCERRVLLKYLQHIRSHSRAQVTRRVTRWQGNRLAEIPLAMNDADLARFIEAALRYDLKPGTPVPIDSLRNATQIDQRNRERGMLTLSLRESKLAGTAVDVLVRLEICLRA